MRACPRASGQRVRVSAVAGAARLLIRAAPQARVTTEAPKLIRSSPVPSPSSHKNRAGSVVQTWVQNLGMSSSEQTLAEQADHQLSSRGRAPQLNAAEGQLQHRHRLSAGGRRGMPAGGAKQPGQRASRGGRVNSSGQCPGVQGASPAVRQSPQSSPHCAVGRGRRRRRKPNLWCAQTACSSMR